MRKDNEGKVILFETEDELTIDRQILEVGESGAQVLNAARLSVVTFGLKSIKKEEVVSLGVPRSPKYKETSVRKIFQAYPPSVNKSQG